MLFRSHQREELKGAEARYQQLLKSTAMQSMANLGGSGQFNATAAPQRQSSVAPTRAGAKIASNRNVFIQIVGCQGVGKTSMLEGLIKDHDPTQLQKFHEQRPNLMTHHQIQMGERLLKLLDCSGNSRAQHLVKEWFSRSIWVCVVYDMSSPKSLDQALELSKEVSAAGAKLVLFGNKYNIEQGQTAQVDVMAAKDAAVRNEGIAVESSALVEAVRLALSATEEAEGLDPQTGQVGLDGLSPDGNKRSSISAAIDSVKSWFGAADRQGGRSGNQGVLRPSLKGTKAMKSSCREGDVNADLRPVQELQDSESAVTCIAFGQERLHRAYILLATASKDEIGRAHV